MQRFIVAIAVVFAGAACVFSADRLPPVFSGPQVGEKLPSINVSLAYGSEAGRVVDLMKMADNKPTLLVIVNGANRPAASLTRCLMNFAAMEQERLFAGVVYLGSDRSGAEQYLRGATSWWQVEPPIGVSTDGPEGPGSYGLNRNVNVTVLIADKGRVTANYALIQPSLTDAHKILGDAARLAEFRIPSQAEISFLSIPTAKPANARWRSAPADVPMRRLICDALAADSEERARAAATAVEDFVGNDVERQAVLGGAAETLLEGHRRPDLAKLPIIPHMLAWREKYAPPSEKKR